jgi:hypothetical protein
VRDVTHRENVERPTSEWGAAKVTEIWRAIVSNDREIVIVECTTILLVHKRVGIEQL